MKIFSFTIRGSTVNITWPSMAFAANFVLVKR